MDISQLSSKQSLLMTSLYKFYENTGNTDKLLDVISGQNNVSLRIIDWFVTNYSKKNNIIYSFKKIVKKQENCVNLIHFVEERESISIIKIVVLLQLLLVS